VAFPDSQITHLSRLDQFRKRAQSRIALEMISSIRPMRPSPDKRIIGMWDQPPLEAQKSHFPMRLIRTWQRPSA
jgi:hypothetical protein